MRLGGVLFDKYESPDEWVEVLQRCGYSAAYCPIDYKQNDSVVESYAKAANNSNIVIAEVGIWNNPICSDEKKRRKAIEYCQKQLNLADRIGALCCVNIAGSRDETIGEPHKDNFTSEKYELAAKYIKSTADNMGLSFNL